MSSELLSDTLLVRDVQGRHILSTGLPKPLEVSDFGLPNAGGVTWPGCLSPAGVKHLADTRTGASL
jgi:hypothetical protein